MTYSQRGSAPVELLLFVPFVILAWMVLVWASVGPTASGQTLTAANASARAAAMSSTPGDAALAAVSTANEMMTRFCSAIAVDVDSTGWDDGWVGVTLTCTPKTDIIEEIPTQDKIVASSVEKIPQFGSRG